MQDPELAKAVQLHASGRLPEAVNAYQRLLLDQAQNEECLQLLAVCHAQMGATARGVQCIEQALAINPNNARTHFALGEVLRQSRRPLDALASYSSCIRLDPSYVPAYLNCGLLLDESGRHADAIANFDALLARQPQHVGAVTSRANALQALGRYDEAIDGYRRALGMTPGTPDAHAHAHANLAALLQRLNRFDEALAHVQKSLQLLPSNPAALTNRATILHKLGHPAESLASLHEALRIAPNFPGAMFQLGIHHLTQGDFDRGWRGFEWRWLDESLRRHRRHYPAPQWNGGPVKGNTLLVHAEQGYGDTLQFARFLPLLARTWPRVLIEVPQPLANLFRRTYAGVLHVLDLGEAPSAFDAHLPLMSAAGALNIASSTIPPYDPPFAVDPTRLAYWSRHLNQAPGLCVGLCWSGNAQHQNDATRSIALQDWTALIRRCTPSARFVCLQKEVRDADRAALEQLPQISCHFDDINDFDDLAAMIRACDLVISVDTAVAHMAGAVGTPVWVLLPYVPDWRWMRERQDSPWYPSARLIRQQRFGDWQGVLTTIAEALSSYAPVPASGQ